MPKKIIQFLARAFLGGEGELLPIKTLHITNCYHASSGGIEHFIALFWPPPTNTGGNSDWSFPVRKIPSSKSAATADLHHRGAEVAVPQLRLSSLAAPPLCAALPYQAAGNSGRGAARPRGDLR